MLAFLAVGLLIIIIPNPIHNQFPQWIKNYENYKDPHSNVVVDVEQLEIMSQDPLLCYKNADCMLLLCGKTPNCFSSAINKEYFEKNQENLPHKYQCPQESELEPKNCGNEAELDAYASCEEGQCVKKRLFPTPTPSTSGIIEKAIYNKK